METRPESNAALLASLPLEASLSLEARLLPGTNDDPEDRAIAWREWYETVGARAVMAFIRAANDTAEGDADILQDAVATAYIEVTAGKYAQRSGVPFTAYVKGIAHNKIRDARRRSWRTVPLDATPPDYLDSGAQHTEALIERREMVSLVRKGIARLSPCRRQVLEGYLNGQSTEEIADALGVTQETVRQHRSRGVRNLQEAVGYTAVRQTAATRRGM